MNQEVLLFGCNGAKVKVRWMKGKEKAKTKGSRALKKNSFKTRYPIKAHKFFIFKH